MLEIAEQVLGASPNARTLAGFLDALPSIDERELGAWAKGEKIERAAESLTPSDLIGFIDLTSLHSTDTPDAIRALVDQALAPDAVDASCPRPAAVCVTPDLVWAARDRLDATDSDIQLASVAGAFPSGRSPLVVRVAEVVAAVSAGADEIDVVIDRGAMLAGDPWSAFEQLVALRAATRRPDGSAAGLKVIVEAGELDVNTEYRAGFVAALAGADFLKTSTGMISPAATPENTAVLAQVARHWREATDGRQIGVKAAGGVRTVADAARLTAVVQEVCGDQQLTPELYRIGASHLLDALVAQRSA